MRAYVYAGGVWKNWDPASKSIRNTRFLPHLAIPVFIKRAWNVQQSKETKKANAIQPVCPCFQTKMPIAVALQGQLRLRHFLIPYGGGVKNVPILLPNATVVEYGSFWKSLTR